jgi:hypothetical protein
MNLEYVGLIGLVVLILLAVLAFFLLSQRNLKANAQRIREEFGQPGERDLAIAQSTETSDPGAWDPSSADSSREAIAQLDAKLAQVHEAVRAAEQQIARLEKVIERAAQLGR